MIGLNPSRIPHARPQPCVPVHLTDVKARSVGERWANLVLKQCNSPDDLKTLKDWARFAGVSYSSLCEACRLVDLRPHEARDFARALRALIHARIHQCQPRLLLDISDRRTLKSFVAHAGDAFIQRPGMASLEPFVAQQLFVPTTSEGVKMLVQLLQDDGSERPSVELIQSSLF